MVACDISLHNSWHGACAGSVFFGAFPRLDSQEDPKHEMLTGSLPIQVLVVTYFGAVDVGSGSAC
eukprot:1155039-Pelagomonas_calceolata.AAC.3